MKYLIANWKAHKTEKDVLEWCGTFRTLLEKDSHAQQILETKACVIICPPFPYLDLVKRLIPSSLPIFYGAQDISRFPQGSYTGEVPAEMIATLVQYVIIGHSERRTHMHESDDELVEKIELAVQNHIQPILCIRGTDDVQHNVPFLAYEPVDAIGTGHNKSAAEVVEMKKILNISNQKFIYGGSVNAQDCKEYVQSDEIDGLLIGSASLDPHEFFSILKHVV